MVDVDTNTQVSHEQDGRVLSGMGADAEKLADVMDRHAPAEPAAKPETADAKPPTETPPPPVSRGRQRFSDLTRERDEARGETAKEREARLAVEKERDEYRQKFEQASKPAAEPAKAEPAKAAEPTRPKPKEDEIGSKYATYADFAEDLADWKYEQREAARGATSQQQIREQIAAEREHQRILDAATVAQERGRKAYPDFDALLNSPAGQIALGRNEQESGERFVFIVNHPQSEHIQYAILKDQTLARKLQQSDPIAFGVTIAGLVPAAKPTTPTWTPPPSPPPTVGASSPTAPSSSSELAKKGFDFDASGYREKRAAERGGKGPRRW